MIGTVALAGNPNCGKTTLFNRLTGANQYVGNWPGVTVERKEGRLKGHHEVTVVDLPGTYSLSPYTMEERVARSFIVDGGPDVIVDIIDGTNLERNLYLADQLRELGVPLVAAVNMMDVVRANGDAIDIEALSRYLGCPVLEISALKGDGVDQLVETVLSGSVKPSAERTVFDPVVEDALAKISGLALGGVAAEKRRWYAIKLFERDGEATSSLNLAPDVKASIEQIVSTAEAELDDDAESLITTGRYEQIGAVIPSVADKPSAGKVSVSDRIDRVVTNRILGLPIFVLVMFLVYYLSISTVGTYFTDWVNDGVFGDGWFAGSVGREDYDAMAEEYDPLAAQIEAYETALVEAEGLDAEADDYADQLQLAVVANPDFSTVWDNYDQDTGENESVTVDAAAYEQAESDLSALIAANPEHFNEDGELDPATFGPWVPGIPTLVGEGLSAVNCAPWLQGLILDGIIAGVGAVIGFVPQMLVLFFCLAFLEGCGYMARIAFVLDRVFRRFGLSGKSFIPILIGTGCGVPGVMASRTIENENDRHLTIMTTTFIPCSAKLPIIALFAGAIFGNAWWVAASAYFMGIAAILCSGIILKKTKPFQSPATPFVMELPAYHWPTAGSVLRSMWERAWSFIKKAGTLILAAAVVIWFLSGYGVSDGAFGAVADQNDSLLAVISSAIAWIFYPLGWGALPGSGIEYAWQPTAATITGLIAKENVVGTMGILYAGGAGWYANLQASLTPVAAYSLLAFNLLCAPCFAAMGAIKREMGSRVWFWRAIGYECGIAYTTSLMIYQLVGLVTGEVPPTFWTVAAAGVLIVFLYLLLRPARDRGEVEGVGGAGVVASEQA